jgi:F-type H+-transporting ATPase subunit a
VVATIFFFIVISNWLSLTPVFNVIGWVGHEDSPETQIEEHGFVHGIIFEDAGPFNVNPFSSPSNLRVTSDENVIEKDDPEGIQKYEEAKADGKKVGELIPLFRGINTDLNTPLAIAIAAVIAVEWWGISALGLFTYGGKFFNFHGPIDFFVGILELVSEIVRLVSFTFRLFGNMFAGEVVILMFTFLTPLPDAAVLRHKFSSARSGVYLLNAHPGVRVMAVSHQDHAAEGTTRSRILSRNLHS